jgi:hypothetical protein
MQINYDETTQYYRILHTHKTEAQIQELIDDAYEMYYDLYDEDSFDCLTTSSARQGFPNNPL